MSNDAGRSTPTIPTRRTWGQRLVLTLNLGLIVTALTVAAFLGYANDRASSINRVALDRSLTELATDEPGERVINVLLVGSDSSANLDPDDPIQIGRQGERLGDVIILAHLDERTGQAALLSLPRDLWIPIAGSERSDRINRAFLIGGPATLIDTIEEAFGIPVHHYVNVDFAGFQGLVEAVGSVEVQFDAPARDWNINASPRPRSQTGFLVTEPGCHALDPEQALAYVRSRYYQVRQPDGRWATDPTSDLGRIRRQQDFLQRLLQEAIEQGARNPMVLSDLIDTGIQNVAIDHELTPSLLLELSSTYRDFEPGDLQTYTFPVVDGTVGANRVLLPRTDEAEPLLELFRGAGFDDPATVGVRVRYDPASFATGPLSAAAGTSAAEGPPRAVITAVEALDRAGFEIGAGERVAGTATTRIIHSGDGAAAAALLVEALPASLGPPILVEDPTVTGRNLILELAPPADDEPDRQPLDPAPADDGGGDEQVAGPASAADDPLPSVGVKSAVPEGPTVSPLVTDDPAFTAVVSGPPRGTCSE